LSDETFDAVAYNRNTKALIDESKKQPMNMAVIQQLLSLTFQKRHDTIKASIKSVTDILAEFPFLKRDILV
jgi:hypothetical protein